jgi:energy-coupling factor transport system ATP-binding protein
MDQPELQAIQPFARIENVSFYYPQHGREPLRALAHVSLTIEPGSHVAILGRNGSGKSTLARLINALELPSEGTLVIGGHDTRDGEKVWEVRRLCGMVFQNPDNQIVGTTVEEDVAFGPENLGFPQPKIRAVVDQALERVNLSSFAERPPHLLSGGQKQKLAIAGILAMQPACLILDEATSMLDPLTRSEFMALVQDLIAEQQLTVINITHHMEEALLADRVIIMNEGHVVVSERAEVFDRVRLVKDQGWTCRSRRNSPASAELTRQTLRPQKQPAGSRPKRQPSACCVRPTAACYPVWLRECSAPAERRLPDAADVLIQVEDLSCT